MLNGLYRVISQSYEQIVFKLSDKSHPLFEAHFPHHPILPGFALIDIVSEVLQDEVTYIKYSKFIKSIFPNDILECQISKNDKRRMVKIFRNNEKVSEIAYEAK